MIQIGEKGKISKSDFKLEVDEIAMQVEELSAKTGGIPYTDILKEVADCLELWYSLNLKHGEFKRSIKKTTIKK